MEYIKKTTVKYNLDRDVQFNTTVTESIWDEQMRKWKIKANNNGVVLNDEADVLVNGSGILKFVALTLYMLSSDIRVQQMEVARY